MNDQLFDMWLMENPSISMKALSRALPKEMRQKVLETAFNLPEEQNRMWLAATGLNRFLDQFDDSEAVETYCTDRDRAEIVLYELRKFVKEGGRLPF